MTEDQKQALYRLHCLSEDCKLIASSIRQELKYLKRKYSYIATQSRYILKDIAERTPYKRDTMTLDTKSEQLLTAASDILSECERELREMRNDQHADKVRSAHYLIYLVLKPDTQLVRAPAIPMKPPAASLRSRLKRNLKKKPRK